MDQRRAALAFLLLLLGAALSGLLLLQHHGEGPAVAAVEAVCGAGGQSGCETVARSAYSVVGGVPLAAIGLFFYASLAALLVLALLAGPEVLAAAGRVAVWALVAALTADVVLLGIQALSIKAFCKLCIATYVVNLATLLVLRPVARGTAALATMFKTEGRLAIAGWGLTSGAIAASILAANMTLVYREARRAAGVLGEPSSAAASSAEARRLKEILDDPQKREQYVTDKAVKEFEDATPQALDLTRTPFSGPANAPIRVVEFSDYLCPFCRALAGGFKEYLPKSQGRVAIFYKNYPLDKACNAQLQNTVHEGACWLAQGAICAQEQGRLPAYQDAVYAATPRPMSREDVSHLATGAGLTAAGFEACLDAPGTKARLADEIQEAERVGVKATPTVFVNGKRLPRVNDFLTAVDKEAVRLGLPPLSSPPPARP
jgi:protein-disulfide isomerase/uncharacterized membrane protein